jgi:hypothetical protein
MSARPSSAARDGLGAPAEPTSQILTRLIDAANEPRISLGDVVRGLGDRTFGFLILIFALPNGVPGPSIPGLSTITGVPLILVALQMALGRPRPWLPGWLARRSLPRSGLRLVLSAAAPALAWIERRIRPRLIGPGMPLLDRMVGAYIVLVGMVLALPIPFGNFPPAWALMLMALALIQRDGVAMSVAAIAGIGAVAWNVVLIYLGEELIQAFAYWFGG